LTVGAATATATATATPGKAPSSAVDVTTAYLCVLCVCVHFNHDLEHTNTHRRTHAAFCLCNKLKAIIFHLEAAAAAATVESSPAAAQRINFV